MSPSDATRTGRFLELVAGLADIERETAAIAWPDAMDMDACGRLLGIAARLYVAAAEQKPEDMPLPALGLTATDAVVVAAAALRDQDLTPFDLTLWFQRVVMASRQSNFFTESTERHRPVLGSIHS